MASNWIYLRPNNNRYKKIKKDKCKNNDKLKDKIRVSLQINLDLLN